MKNMIDKIVLLIVGAIGGILLFTFIMQKMGMKLISKEKLELLKEEAEI